MGFCSNLNVWNSLSLPISREPTQKCTNTGIHPRSKKFLGSSSKNGPCSQTWVTRHTESKCMFGWTISLLFVRENCQFFVFRTRMYDFVINVFSVTFNMYRATNNNKTAWFLSTKTKWKCTRIQCCDVRIIHPRNVLITCTNPNKNWTYLRLKPNDTQLGSQPSTHHLRSPFL